MRERLAGVVSDLEDRGVPGQVKRAVMLLLKVRRKNYPDFKRQLVMRGCTNITAQLKKRNHLGSDHHQVELWYNHFSGLCTKGTVVEYDAFYQREICIHHLVAGDEKKGSEDKLKTTCVATAFKTIMEIKQALPRVSWQILDENGKPLNPQELAAKFGKLTQSFVLL